jgi:16S rRNA pseudouridine516 synthase
MRKLQRLDKVLSHLGVGSRSELRRMAKLGRIHVNGAAVKDSSVQIDPLSDRLEVDGELLRYREFVYVMLHKPSGVVSATEDKRDRTVIDLLDDSLRSFEVFPVGRLDKDTEGLLLLTNDGALAHYLLSPRKHVPKTYYAHVRGAVDESDKQKFLSGVTLDDGYVTLPAQLDIIKVEQRQEGAISSIQLTIHEGKFHQVKRMFESVGKKVTYLKRLSMGPLELDQTLPLGAYRELTEQEVYQLKLLLPQ